MTKRILKMATSNSTIAVAISDYENRIGGKFKPDHRFYDKVGINKYRFAKLVRNEVPAYVFEMKALSDFFQVPFDQLIQTAPVMDQKESSLE